MKKLLRNTLFLLAFWPLFFLAKVLTVSILTGRKVVSVRNRFFGKFYSGNKAAVDNNRLPDSVMYFAAFFPENAGYEYRVRQWAERLEKKGVKTAIRTVFTREQFEKMDAANALMLYLTPLYKRFFQILESFRYDRVIVRRELVLYTNYGNLFLDELLLSIHPKAVLDFDDDLGPAKGEPRKPSGFERFFLYDGDSFNASLRLYKRFFAGSEYLRERIWEQNPFLPASDIQLVPTCVDYTDETKFPSKQYTTDLHDLNFGWIGSNGNQVNLDEVIPALDQFSGEYPAKVSLHVISGKAYKPPQPVRFEIVNKAWGLESQIDDLMQVDIGLMPLDDSVERLGKCGFKLIQYMGLGIVSMASAVTENRLIISHDLEGKLVYKKEDWLMAFRQIAARRMDFPLMGRQAQRRIEQCYSFDANETAYLEFLSNKALANTSAKVQHSSNIRA